MTLESVLSPIDMEAFENCVYAWFSDSMGIEVKWAGDSKTMPEYPVGVLQIISGPVAVSPQFELRSESHVSRAAGREVEQIACVPCTFTVSCQVWVGGDDRWHPHANARYHLNKALGGLGLPSYLEAFKAADVAVINSNPIQDISSIQENAFVSRANMDVRFGAALNAIEYAGYIKTIAAEGTFEGTNQTIDREFGDI